VDTDLPTTGTAGAGSLILEFATLSRLTGVWCCYLTFVTLGFPDHDSGQVMIGLKKQHIK
jgi:hypothetical protein